MHELQEKELFPYILALLSASCKDTLNTSACNRQVSRVFFYVVHFAGIKH